VPAAAFENDTTNFLKMTATDQKNMTTALNDMREHLGKWQSSERIIGFEEIVNENMLAPSKGEEIQ